MHFFYAACPGGEGAVLKTVGCERLAGSNPVCSASRKEVTMKQEIRVIIETSDAFGDKQFFCPWCKNILIVSWKEAIERKDINTCLQCGGKVLVNLKH